MILHFCLLQKQHIPSFYKSNPDEILALKSSVTSPFTGTRDQSETSQQQEVTEQQEADSEQQQQDNSEQQQSQETTE